MVAIRSGSLSAEHRTGRDDRRSAFRLRERPAACGRFALWLAPLARTKLVTTARVVAVVLAIGYVIGLAAALAAGGGPMPDLTTLSGLAHAFSTPRVMLVGWVHYLAFDLWVGAWEAEEAGRCRMPHAALVPCLVLTFLAGPVGLLLFLVLRAKWRPSA